MRTKPAGQLRTGDIFFDRDYGICLVLRIDGVCSCCRTNPVLSLFTVGSDGIAQLEIGVKDELDGIL